MAHKANMICLLLALSPLAWAGGGPGKSGKGGGGGPGGGPGGPGGGDPGMHPPPMPDAFQLGYTVSWYDVNLPKPVQVDGSVTFDGENKYFDFAFKIKNMADLEKLMVDEAPLEEVDSSLSSVESIEESEGLDGDEVLSFNVRLENAGEHEEFSMLFGVENSNQDQPLCIDEKKSPEDLQHEVIGALPEPPSGGGDNGGIGEMEEEAPFEDERGFDDLEGEVEGEVPFDSPHEAEGEMVNEFTELISKEKSILPGLEEAKLHTNLFFKDLAKQMPDAHMPPTAPPGFPSHIHVFGSDADGIKNVLIPLEAQPLDGKIWFNVTSVKHKGEFERKTGPVCSSNAEGLDDAVQDASGLVMPAPACKTQDECERRLQLGKGPRKLAALEKLSKLFLMVKMVVPQSRKVLPNDATRLWNKKDLHAAKIERALTKKVQSITKLTEVNGRAGPFSQASGLAPAIFVVFGLVLFVAGLAIGRRSKPQSLESGEAAALMEA